MSCSWSYKTVALFFLLLQFMFASTLNEIRFNPQETVVGEMVPMMNEVMAGHRKLLSSFQICAMCTCCGGGAKGYCLPSPCCYSINCNIPNRPFGYCAFTPRTCNCLGCHL